MNKISLSAVLLAMCGLTASAENDVLLERLFSLADSCQSRSVIYYNDHQGAHQMTIIASLVAMSGETISPQQQRLGQQMASTLQMLSHRSQATYHYESHTGVRDSVEYSLILSLGDSQQPMSKPTHLFHSGAPDEYLTKTKGTGGRENLSYILVGEQPSERTPYAWRMQQIGHNKVIDTLGVSTQPFDAEVFCQRIVNLVGQPGITLRTVHYYHDENDKGTPMHYEPHHAGKGETFGLHYYTDSWDQGLALLRGLEASLEAHIAEYPNQKYRYMPHVSADKSIEFASLLASVPDDDDTDSMPARFDIYYSRDMQGLRWHFLLLRTQGDLLIPENFENVKDYNNGRLVCYP